MPGKISLFMRMKLINDKIIPADKRSVKSLIKIGEIAAIMPEMICRSFLPCSFSRIFFCDKVSRIKIETTIMKVKRDNSM